LHCCYFVLTKFAMCIIRDTMYIDVSLTYILSSIVYLNFKKIYTKIKGYKVSKVRIRIVCCNYLRNRQSQSQKNDLTVQIHAVSGGALHGLGWATAHPEKLKKSTIIGLFCEILYNFVPVDSNFCKVV